MGSINTEEAARRLARVILSDIELYNRERPKPGETLEGQIEEGRRLFASRVTPDLLPVFGLVLSDRALRGVNAPVAAEPPPTSVNSPVAAEPPSTSVNAPVAAEPPSTSASDAAAFGPDDASPASTPTIQEPPAPAPAIAAQSLEDQSTPAPTFTAPPLVDQPALTARVSMVAAEPPSASAGDAAAFGPDDASLASTPTIQEPPAPAPAIVAHSLEDQSTPAPTLRSLEDQSTPAPTLQSLEDQPTPAPTIAAPSLVDRPAPTARVPTTPRAPETPAVLAQARLAAPPAQEIPIPVLTARFSLPRLLVIVSVVAAAVAVLYHVLP